MKTVSLVIVQPVKNVFQTITNMKTIVVIANVNKLKDNIILQQKVRNFIVEVKFIFFYICLKRKLIFQLIKKIKNKIIYYFNFFFVISFQKITF